MKTLQGVIVDLAYIAALVYLARCAIISGDAVLIGLGLVGGAMGARRLSRKNSSGDTIPPSAVGMLFTGIPRESGK